MHPRFAVVVALLIVGRIAGAQDPLAEANAAWRQGDLPRAARLFAAAADAETDPAKRAAVRIRLAWTDYLLKNRAAAEKSLAAAISDQPQLELASEYYTADFVALFARVRARAARSAARSAPPATPSPPATLAALRQRLAQAVDSAAVDLVLGNIAALEASTPPNGLADLLDVKAEALERLGRGEDALVARGRVAALRAAAQAPGATSPWPLDTLLEARRLLANREPDDAAALMRGVLKEEPSCMPALDIMGEALLAAGRLDEAYGALQTAVVANETPELLMALGEVEVQRDRPADARSLFRRAVEADPGNDRAWAALGIVAARLDDHKGAEDALDRALQENGTLFAAHVLRAQLALLDGDPSSAAQHLQRALQVKPDDPWASGWLGVAYLTSGDVAGAERFLQKGFGADRATFALALVELRRREDKTADALKLIADGETGDPADAALLRARCLLDLGRTREAIEVLRSDVALHPDDADAAYVLGVALHRERDWGGSLAAFVRAAGLRGHPPAADAAVAAARATVAAQELMQSAATVPPPQARH
jgi:tetratricopeptide (TPR) repeat protein